MVLSGNVKHTLDEITKHQEIIDWNNIISDVDLLLPLFWSCPQSIMYGENIEDAKFYANYFRDVTHIMPYKEDILDSVTTKLDKVGDIGFHLCGNDLMDLYKNRKMRLKIKFFSNFYLPLDIIILPIISVKLKDV